MKRIPWLSVALWITAALWLVACTTPGGLLKPSQGQPVVSPFLDGRQWVVRQPVAFTLEQTGETLVVPEGFVTDFASTPKEVWMLLPPTGMYALPALVHDYLYWTHACTKEQADAVFLMAMNQMGVDPLKQGLMYNAVALAGLPSWEQNDRERKNGLVRIIPAKYMDIPRKVDWETYRQELKDNGVKDGPDAYNSDILGFCRSMNNL